MPAGEVGEILVRGPQVMRGYWKEPEATAKVLRDGWLWTGDLAVADEDGICEIVGRSKELIITGGLNVYPAEVEHVLRAAPGVDDVAVVGVPSARWGEEVVAVLVAGPAGIDRDQVLAHARTYLAGYKCAQVAQAWAEVARQRAHPDAAEGARALAEGRRARWSPWSPPAGSDEEGAP